MLGGAGAPTDADLKQEIEDPEGPIHTDFSNLWNIFLWGEREEEVMQQ